MTLLIYRVQETVFFLSLIRLLILFYIRRHRGCPSKISLSWNRNKNKTKKKSITRRLRFLNRILWFINVEEKLSYLLLTIAAGRHRTAISVDRVFLTINIVPNTTKSENLIDRYFNTSKNIFLHSNVSCCGCFKNS